MDGQVIDFPFPFFTAHQAFSQIYTLSGFIQDTFERIRLCMHL
jgi:hypothetical protein